MHTTIIKRSVRALGVDTNLNGKQETAWGVRFHMMASSLLCLGGGFEARDLRSSIRCSGTLGAACRVPHREPFDERRIII